MFNFSETARISCHSQQLEPFLGKRTELICTPNKIETDQVANNFPVSSSSLSSLFFNDNYSQSDLENIFNALSLNFLQRLHLHEVCIFEIYILI